MYNELLPQEVVEKIRRNEPVNILDVREQEEWEAGHIPGAKHIPLGEIAKALNELNPKQATVIVCRSGNRSARACDYLAPLGYNVANMLGGMSAWTGDIKIGK